MLAREVPQFAQPRWPAVLVAVVRDEVTRTRAERRAVAEPSLRHGAGTQVDQALELQTFSRALDCRRPNLERAVHLNCTRGRCCLQRVGRLLQRRAARAREPVRRWRGAQHAAVLSRPRDALSLLLRLRCLLLPLGGGAPLLARRLTPRELNLLRGVERPFRVVPAIPVEGGVDEVRQERSVSVEKSLQVRRRFGEQLGRVLRVRRERHGMLRVFACRLTLAEQPRLREATLVKAKAGETRDEADDRRSLHLHQVLVPQE